MALSFIEVIAVITNLIMLAVAGGLAFSSIFQPNRKTSSYTFATFCITLVVWASISLLQNLSTVDVALPSRSLLQLQASAMAFTVIAYFFFILLFIEPSGPVANLLTVLSPVVLIVSLVVIWTTNAITLDDTGQLTLVPIMYSLIISALVYLLVSFWSVLSSDNPYSNLLVLPSLGIVLAYAVNMFSPLVSLPVDSIILTASVLWAGVVLLRAQVFNPVNQINRDLQAANRNLQHVVNDLADEKSKTEELNQELIAANRYKSEFLANISHELRTPLNSIIGYSELLRSQVYGDLTDTQQDRIEKIYRNGMSLLELISDILDLNKIDAGKMKLGMQLFDLQDIIQQVQAQHQTDAEEKGIAIELKLEDDIPHLYGDILRIKQIVDNLLDNALKFTSEGKVSLQTTRIEVKNGRSQTFNLPTLGWLQDGSWAILSVSDTGIGITPEQQGRIFDEFAQADGSHTREYEGTGMGLAISKRLVEMHRGAIWVNSRPGEGSTFYVALPCDVDQTKQVYADNTDNAG